MSALAIEQPVELPEAVVDQGLRAVLFPNITTLDTLVSPQLEQGEPGPA